MFGFKTNRMNKYLTKLSNRMSDIGDIINRYNLFEEETTMITKQVTNVIVNDIFKYNEEIRNPYELEVLTRRKNERLLIIIMLTDDNMSSKMTSTINLSFYLTDDGENVYMVDSIYSGELAKHTLM